MTWVLILLLLIAIFGIGTLLEAAFWTLLIIAAVVALGVWLVARKIRD